MTQKELLLIWLPWKLEEYASVRYNMQSFNYDCLMKAKYIEHTEECVTFFSLISLCIYYTRGSIVCALFHCRNDYRWKKVTLFQYSTVHEQSMHSCYIGTGRWTQQAGSNSMLGWLKTAKTGPYPYRKGHSIIYSTLVWKLLIRTIPDHSAH